jgi:hypothetical protein
MKTKKMIIFLFVCVLSMTYSFAQTADEKAIKAVCEAETKAWHAGDKATHAACWNIADYSRTYVSTTDGMDIVVMPTEMKNPTPEALAAMGSGATFSNSNYNLRVNGNMALITYDQVSTAKDGKKFYSHEIRNLEKVNGAWKIILVSVHSYNSK